MKVHFQSCDATPRVALHSGDLAGCVITCVALVTIFVTPARLTAQSAAAENVDRTFAATTTGADVVTDDSFVTNIVERACRSDTTSGVESWDVAGWSTYQRLWNEIAQDPGDLVLRKYLGLPIGSSADKSVTIKSGRGRSAPQWLGWRSGSYRQYETPHFQIFSHADDKTTREVAADLERAFWVWTQLFFPLWEGQPQVALHLKDVAPEQSVSSALSSRRTRLTTRRKLRVVLLKDAADYAKTLGQSMPGIEQSTGFYSDERRTSFFYPSSSADAIATRRHELVHQLFREATRSNLSGQSPGNDADFWLVEGVAGYFESLHLDGTAATLGGWDSSRLQFARFRVLGARDLIPFSELRVDGQSQAQKRGDLARWYANAIAYTHVLMDGSSVADRRWIYQLLADLYNVPITIPGSNEPESPERTLVDALKIDDNVLIANPSNRAWTQLCLSGCEITSRGLRTLTASADCQWIDLSRQPVNASDIQRLCPSPSGIDQLSLEATRVDDSIATWLEKTTKLRELDLSWTSCSDSTVASISGNRQLRTLWLTGSSVTDASIPQLIRLANLESLDVQRTKITSSGLAELRKKRPDCNLNPLQLRTQ